MPTTMNLIAKQTVSSSGAASITFSNIPQTFTDLKLVMSARGSASGTRQNVLIQLNGSGSSFTWLGLYGFNTSVQSNTTSNNFAGNIPNSSNTANTFGTQEIYIPNYTSTNAKSLSIDYAVENNGTDNFLGFDADLWNPGTQAPITSITLSINSSGNFVEFSDFSLYGISNSSTQNEITPYASGGDIIRTDGTYWYHSFLYSGIFTPLKNLECDYLIVAGGGGGGSNGGGGGAGGYKTSIGGTALSLIANTAYVSQVGSGGPGAVLGSYIRGTNGTNSVFSTINTMGGGAGAGPGGFANNGGSGGGGGWGSGNSAKGLASPTGQGNNGGDGVGTAGGGGGGASAVGGTGASYVSGNGGNGLANSISGTSVTYAGGGGGGGGNYGVTPGSGGTGGGGNGALVGENGTANLGGGAGGGGGDGRAGGNGGSGIIIVRYAV
jgi:hypothetical protein